MTQLTREVERRLAKLDALEAGGVDNWDGYDFALEEYRATIEHEEKIEILVDEILEAVAEFIEEPAGRGCGYGIREGGYEAATNILIKRVKVL